MRVEDLRQRVMEKMREVAGSGDEDGVARFLDFSKALLLTLASRPSHVEVDLQKLTLKTGTAARIFGMHQEYVRELIRKGELNAGKEKGEFQIPLSEVVRFQAKNESLRSKPGAHGSHAPHAPWTVTMPAHLPLIGRDWWNLYGTGPDEPKAV